MEEISGRRGSSGESRPRGMEQDERRAQVRKGGDRVREAAERRAEHEFGKRSAAASHPLDDTATALEGSARAQGRSENTTRPASRDWPMRARGCCRACRARCAGSRNERS